MRFTKPFWAGIADGSITVAFRRWRAPTVVAGRPYRTGGGRIEVLSVRVVDPERISAADARRSGHRSADEVRAQLRTPGRAGPGPLSGTGTGTGAGAEGDGSDRTAWPVYRVEFRRLDEPDPRAELAADDQLGPDDVAAITARLDRLDRASPIGPWTRPTLALIAGRPAVRAPDLAASVGRETQPFKIDVRKLKNLGLTHSLKVGYELSPRGRAYLRSTDPGLVPPPPD